jgi:hypothetical protein
MHNFAKLPVTKEPARLDAFITQEMARRIVRSAIHRGDLVRPDSCERCGATPGPGIDGRTRIQAHHADYSRPLDVEWICAMCHYAITPRTMPPGPKSTGESNGKSKLNDAVVISIRRLRANGLSYQKIADRFEVDKKTVMRAAKGESWSHVAAPDHAEESK